MNLRRLIHSEFYDFGRLARCQKVGPCQPSERIKTLQLGEGPRLYTRSGASSVHAAKGLVCTRGMGLLYVPVYSYSCVFCVLHVCRLSCTGLQQLYFGLKVIVVGSVVHGSSCCFCLSFFAWHRHGFAVCISLFLQLCILCAPCAQVVLYRSWAVSCIAG